MIRILKTVTPETLIVISKNIENLNLIIGSGDISPIIAKL